MMSQCSMTAPTLAMRSADLWQQLMRYETDFSFPLELPFFYESPDWLRAHSVIDLGTGTAEHLTRLAVHFPAKRYTGIDIDGEFIAAAHRAVAATPELAATSITLRVCNVLNAEGPFDAAVARLLVQHLTDVDTFLTRTRAILRPGGALVVIDSNDHARRFAPELPTVRRFFERLRAARRRAGCNRDAAVNLAARAERAGFRLARAADLIVPSTPPTYRDLFFELYSTVFELVRLEHGVEIDANTLHDELRSWRALPHAYAQIGVHLACYVRG